MNYLRSERGASIVLEVVLVAVVLCMVGFAVYSSAHDKPAPVVVTTTPAPTPSPSATPSSSPAALTYLQLTELGLKLPLTSEIKDLIYTYSPSTSDLPAKLHFSTTSISALADGFCGPSHDPLGTYTVYPSAQSNATAGALTASVGGHFIYYTHVQYGCGDTAAQQAKVASLIAPLNAAVQKAQPK